MRTRATASPDGALLRLRVRPRASRDEIVGWQDGTLCLRVAAPPVEGEANRAVEALLARVLGIAPSRIRVVRGERGREKLVRIAGLSPADVRTRLA
ncbi:MAG: DUF167 domain-containing protein [candidate division NC10 bacterium]